MTAVKIKKIQFGQSRKLISPKTKTAKIATAIKPDESLETEKNVSSRDRQKRRHKQSRRPEISKAVTPMDLYSGRDLTLTIGFVTLAIAVISTNNKLLELKQLLRS